MSRQATALALALVGAGLVAGIVQLSQRVDVERADDRVALVLDQQELARLAAVSGVDAPEVLRRMGDNVSHVAVAEQTWDDLRALGAFHTWGPTAVPYGYTPPGYTVLHFADWTRGEQVLGALDAKGIKASPPRSADGKEYVPSWIGRSILVPTAALQATDLGLGYDRQAIEQITRSGLGIVARPRSALVGTPAAVRGALRLAKGTGANIVVFLGNEVVGNPAAVGETAAAMQELGLRFGWVELSPQFGEERLAHSLPANTVRTHSIGELETHVLLPAAAVERYARAVRERGVRVAYVRLLPTAEPGSDLLTTNVGYVKRVKAAIESEGFQIGEPRPAPPLEVHPAVRWLAAIGVGAMVLLAASALGINWGAWWLIVFCLLLLFGAAVAVSDLARHVAALLGVVTAAILGLLMVKPRDQEDPNALRSAVGQLVLISAVTVVLASLSVALLGDRLHLIGIELFRGVKLSLLLPPLVVLAVHVARSTRSYWQWQTEAGGKQEAPALVAGAREAADYVVRYWHVILALVLLGLAALMVVRSGNEPLFGLSGVETKLRSVLEQTVGVRPRTKEFAVGHPLLLLALWMLYRGRRRAVWLILTGGAIGQASLANTFCHIHTPYLLSIQRGIIGLVCGVVAGLMLVGLWSLAEGYLQRRQSPRKS